jgi:hypothetical protein
MKTMKTVKVFILCILAALANYALSTFAREALHLSLFLDTVFTCAVAFAAGALPGIITAVLTTALNGIFRRPDLLIHLYALCPIAEVLLIRLFCRLFLQRENQDGKDGQFSLVNTISALLLLYISMCMIISALGGIIDFTITMALQIWDYEVIPLTFFKLGLLRNGLPLLAVNIFSRIPVNIIDRFICAFGGYGLGLLIRRILPKKTLTS